MAWSSTQLLGLVVGAVAVYYYFALVMQATGWRWTDAVGFTIMALVVIIYSIVWMDACWNKEVRCALPRSPCELPVVLLTPLRSLLLACPCFAGAQIIKAHNHHIVSDTTHGIGDGRQNSGRRFRTEINDGDGDGRADHIAMSEVVNHADGDDRTTHQRQVKLTLEE
jgi:hypothetical protein